MPTKNSAVVSSQGKISIPSVLRDRHGLHKGTQVIFREESGRLILEPSKCAALSALRGSLRHLPLEEELEKLRAEEREREDKKFAEFDPLARLAGTWTFGDADEYVSKQRGDE